MAIRSNSRVARLGAALFLAVLALTVQAGPLEPPVPPGTPTMRPIDQVEPRIPIHAEDLPLTLNESGSYYLAENIFTTGGGIVVQAHDVTIDLMGFRLEGGTGPAIDGWGVHRVTVRNGTIANWSGNGVSVGSGAELLNITVDSCGGTGIHVANDARVVGCTSTANAIHGIYVLSGVIIEGCVASNNVENGIWIHGTAGSVVRGCVVDQNERNGIRVDGYATVMANHVRGNDIVGTNGKAGIWLAGDYNRVEGNTVVGNNIGIDVDGNNNVVVRNVVGDNQIRNFDEDVTATGNYVPVWNVGSAGSPDSWANIEQP